MISKDVSFRKLAENEKFVIGYIFEDAYLIEKKTKKELYIGDFYGDPKCALISINNDWCLIGGATLYVWKQDGRITEVAGDELTWIYDMRQIASDEAELLIDPWSDVGAIWRFNINTFAKQKMQDCHITTDYSEEINW